MGKNRKIVGHRVANGNMGWDRIDAMINGIAASYIVVDDIDQIDLKRSESIEEFNAYQEYLTKIVSKVYGIDPSQFGQPPPQPEPVQQRPPLFNDLTWDEAEQLYK